MHPWGFIYPCPVSLLILPLFCTPSNELATETDLGLERSVAGSHARRGLTAALCLLVRASERICWEGITTLQPVSASSHAPSEPRQSYPGSEGTLPGRWC